MARVKQLFVFATRFTLLILLGSPLTGKSAAAETIVIDHVTVIDGTGRAPMLNSAVVISDGKFSVVGPSSLAQGIAGRRIDGRRKFLIPGLFDVHAHLDGASRQTDGKITIDRNAGEEALASYLYSGVTTIFDAGNAPQNILPLRADERVGSVQGPHIFATGNAINYPGGHGSDISIGVASWPAAEAQLQAQYESQHPDVQKIMYDEEGWGSRPIVPILPQELLQRVIQFYNERGVRTAVHISNETRALEVIFSGGDALAHTPLQGPVTESFVKLVAAKQIPLATTVTVLDNYSRVHDHPEYLDQPLYVATMRPEIRARLKKIAAEQGETALPNSKPLYQKGWRMWMTTQTPILQDNLRRIVEAGGVIATGTDGCCGAGLQRELELLANAGIKPLEVIKAATFNGARFIGKQETMGSIEEGKLADAVLLSADPTRDINNCKSILLVIKGGQIVDESKLPLAGGRQPRRMNF
jgi:imidazolonepropionase-like amidohydrolase